ASRATPRRRRSRSSSFRRAARSWTRSAVSRAAPPTTSPSRSRRRSCSRGSTPCSVRRATRGCRGSVVPSSAHPARGARRAVASRAGQRGRALGLDGGTRVTIRVGALRRDVGNARLPAAILAKSGELSPEERAMLERHPILGEEILSGFKRLSGLLPIVRHHHERLDGTGYPDALRAEQIPLEVRIVSVADRFEALLSDRADRPAVSEAEAVRMLQSAVARGELDAAVVAALATQVRAGGAR